MIRAVWDADFIPFYVCHVKEGEPEKTLEDCIQNCNDLIKNVNDSVEADEFVGFLTIGKCFRYKIYPEYKGNRKYDKLPKYLNEVRTYMKETYGFIGIDGYEADDLILSYKNQNKDVLCIIVSPDKDMLYLEGDHYNPKKNELVKTSKEYAEEYFWTSMIVGDTADNIKGIKGIGPKGASSIINNQKLFSNLRTTILDKYCEVYGEANGIFEFYKNYSCLRIVDDIPFKIDGVLNKIVRTSEYKKETDKEEKEELL